MCEQFFLPPMTVYWNWDDAIGFTKLWTSFTWRIHIVTSNFNIFPSRYWLVIWSIYFSFLFGMMNTAHWLSYFSGVAAWSTSHEVPPQATASRNSWAPMRPVPWISLSFLAIKNGARLYGKESSHDLLLMLVYVGVWGFLIITYNYIVWTLKSLSLFSWVIWIEITWNHHQWP